MEIKAWAMDLYERGTLRRIRCLWCDTAMRASHASKARTSCLEARTQVERQRS